MSLRILDAARLSRVAMSAIIGHWTAGNHKANAVDLRSYHVLTEGDGKIVYGVDIARNSGGTHAGYAAHTRGANTNRIGLSMCGMVGATESPWNPGRAPLTQVQWDAFVMAAADLCEVYRIAVARDKTLFHAEVQGTLGIRQDLKWDVVRLPFDPSVRGARAIGDKWRDEILSALRGNGLATPRPEPLPAAGVGSTGRVTAPTLNFRRGPGTSHDSTGSLPADTRITVLGSDGDWLRVRTPMGYEGWVHGGYVQLIDTAPPPEPTQPDPLHATFADIRDLLDRIEADIPDDRDRLETALKAVTAHLRGV
jgi:hypothetical protein